jgi:hypothetical protein
LYLTQEQGWGADKNMETVTTSKIEKCPCCGALMREYWHSLTPGLVSALVKLHKAVMFYGRNRIHIHDDMKASMNYQIKLTDHEWNNFTRLRFHGLAAKCDEKGKSGSGYWLLTSRGSQFLKGEIFVPLKVKTYRNKVMNHSNEVVGIKEFERKIPSFETDFKYEVKKPIKLPEASLRLF